MSDPFIQILAVYKETKAVDLNVTKLIMAKRSLGWLTRGAMPQAALAHLSVALDVFEFSETEYGRPSEPDDFFSLD